MNDRPILFSPPMVLALLAGSKTQTRRLATSPLRKIEVGDRLWVREEWQSHVAYDDLKPSEMGGEEPVRYDADGAVESWGHGTTGIWGRRRPGMLMSRWASRLTLVVTEKRFQRLLEISEMDAIAEGVVQDPIKGWWVPGVEHSNPDFPWLSRATPREMYGALWDMLNGSGAWLGNPEIVALTFKVERNA